MIIIVSTVTAGVVALALAFASRASNLDEQAEPYRPVRVAIERLPQPEQERMRSDVDAAIGILRDRGLIDERQAQKAWSVGLGKLTWYMKDEHQREART